jgi:pimeloyl-ACP methyl ester carboxylesterase
LPGFVRDEFDAYMRCGRLPHFNTAEVVNIGGAGHWVHHDRLDEFFLRLVRAFLSDAS